MCILNFYTTQVLTSTFCITECISRLIKVTYSQYTSSTSMCFGLLQAHHQGVQPMYTTIGTYYSFQMTVCCPGWVVHNPTRTTDIHLTRMISTNCYIHTVVPPDDRPRYARNMQRLTKYTKNKLCVKLVFLYTIISRWTVNKTQNLVHTNIKYQSKHTSF